MKPRDVPMQQIHSLVRQLAEYSRQEHERARANPAQELRVGAYEAALAYGNATTMAREAAIGMVSDLDRIAERDQDEKTETPHPWPLATLDNHAGVFDPYRVPDQKRRYPAWGIEIDEVSQRSTYLTVQKSSIAGDIFLRVTTGDSGHLDCEAEEAISLPISIEQWRDLNSLVERIAAGQPVPYDEAGNVYTKVPVGSMENED